MRERKGRKPQQLSEEEQAKYRKQVKEFNELIYRLLADPGFRKFINGIIINGMNNELDVFTGNSATYYNAGREAICKSILREFYKVANVDARVKSLVRVLNAERLDFELDLVKRNKHK